MTGYPQVVRGAARHRTEPAAGAYRHHPRLAIQREPGRGAAMVELEGDPHAGAAGLGLALQGLLDEELDLVLALEDRALIDSSVLRVAVETTRRATLLGRTIVYLLERESRLCRLLEATGLLRGAHVAASLDEAWERIRAARDPSMPRRRSSVARLDAEYAR